MSKLSNEVFQSRFWQELTDENLNMNVNGNSMPRGYYNLITSIRDVGLFCKGMSINRHWRLKHVKDYFGIKGNKDKIYDQLLEIKHRITV
jgi:hypothetical protein